jgi:hypothetical protein
MVLVGSAFNTYAIACADPLLVVVAGNLDPLSKQPSSPAFVPVTPSKFDPNQPGSEVGELSAAQCMQICVNGFR